MYLQMMVPSQSQPVQEWWVTMSFFLSSITNIPKIKRDLPHLGGYCAYEPPIWDKEGWGRYNISRGKNNSLKRARSSYNDLNSVKMEYIRAFPYLMDALRQTDPIVFFPIRLHIVAVLVLCIPCTRALPANM